MSIFTGKDEGIKKHLVNVNFGNNLPKPVWTLELTVPNMYDRKKEQLYTSDGYIKKGNQLDITAQHKGVFKLPLEGENAQATLILVASLEEAYQRELDYSETGAKSHTDIELFSYDKSTGIVTLLFEALREIGGENKSLLLAVQPIDSGEKEVVVGAGSELTEKKKSDSVDSTAINCRVLMKFKFDFLPVELQRFLDDSLN